MNPALAVKLRPTGPWRIGSDSGSRNRVDSCLHSDALYSAVTTALASLGSIEEWLNATARAADSPAVAFSSCFPFMGRIDFVAPPRTIWPPVSLGGSRVRWKSARFAPVSLVRSMLAGKRPEDSRWSVDGPSGCLVPAGSPGPFRTSVRWSAAVDRLTGAPERHSVACLEFRPGAGLWAVVSFSSEAARDRWQEPVKAAFRLLADSGLGGERSRGWGRSEPPEFTEGTLPDLILPKATAKDLTEPEPAPEPVGQVPDLPSGADLQVCPPVEEPSPAAVEQISDVPGEGEAEQQAVESAGEAEQPMALIEAAAVPVSAPVEEATPEQSEAALLAPPGIGPLTGPSGAGASACQPSSEPATETELSAPVEEAAPEQTEAALLAPPGIELLTGPSGAAASACQPEASTEPESAPEAESQELAEAPEPPLEQPAGESSEPQPEAEPLESAASQEPPQAQPAADSPSPRPLAPEPQPAPETSPTAGFESAEPLWLLSLFTPSAADAVDWRRGNYAVVTRAGRVESPAGSGDLKKHVQMIAEGSVLLALGALNGSAADVAPDGFAHPVYRAGFAVAIPLPERPAAPATPAVQEAK